MRYFICALESIQLGIPADVTERIIPAAEIKGREHIITLTALFKQTDIASPHGIVLKPGENSKTCTILLTPKIDIDLEIDEEKIHALPEAFSGVFLCFKGAYFNGQNLILLLEPEKLTEGRG